jgi:uncharacterized protein (TIGR02145 family)
MKRNFLTKKFIFSLLISALLSFTACKSDEDKLAKTASNMKSTLNAVEEPKDVGKENSFAGTLVDKRDGKKYKTVKIGPQTWMAENLNYISDSSFCYNNEEGNCVKYGRLYAWSAANSACPAGWHLPSDAEIKILFESVGGIHIAGERLKSNKGWKDGGDGTDSFGFSALPAGKRARNGDYYHDGNFTDFWSSTEKNSNNANLMHLYYNQSYARMRFDYKSHGLSVRCLQD